VTGVAAAEAAAARSRNGDESLVMVGGDGAVMASSEHRGYPRRGSSAFYISSRGYCRRTGVPIQGPVTGACLWLRRLPWTMPPACDKPLILFAILGNGILGNGKVSRRVEVFMHNLRRRPGWLVLVSTRRPLSFPVQRRALHLTATSTVFSTNGEG
jgi:hypothetical protein